MHPNAWLQAVLLDMLDQNTDESRADLAEAIQILSQSVEPGVVDQSFGPWIDRYLELLAEHESKQSSARQQCSQEDPQEPLQ